MSQLQSDATSGTPLKRTDLYPRAYVPLVKNSVLSALMHVMKVQLFKINLITNKTKIGCACIYIISVNP